MRLAYLTGRYPAISHTFILREVHALREAGVHVDTFSIWRTSDDQLLSHIDREEFERTQALLPVERDVWARAHRRAARHPGAVARLVRDAVALSRPGVRGRALGNLWAAEAIVLWDAMSRRDLRHVHVHLNGTAPFVALLACRLGRAIDGGGWSYSMTVHGPSEFYEVHAERLAEKVQEARFVVCISDFARSQLMTLVSEEHWDKLEVVHCGVDGDQFALAERSVNGHAPHVVSVGRLTQVKGQAVLLDAVAQLKRQGTDVTATVIGDGPKRDDLERRAHELGVEDRVEFTGAVAQDQIAAHLERADVFAMSSFAEGIPVVLMEAMATGLPVVATRVMGISELVDDSNGVLTRPGRSDELADALRGLAVDPQRRAALGRAGREKVLAEFDISRSAGSLLSLFRRYIPQKNSMSTDVV